MKESRAKKLFVSYMREHLSDLGLPAQVLCLSDRYSVGIPDVIVMIGVNNRGVAAFFELKVKSGSLSSAQLARLNMLWRLGFYTELLIFPNAVTPLEIKNKVVEVTRSILAYKGSK
jgi:hypothetical protein